MGRILTLLYGVVCYVIFFVTFLYAIGFVGNFVVPKTMDSPGEGPLGMALLVNVLLLGLFAVQHSVMARPTFKAWWTKFVPSQIERSTYVLFASVALIVLFRFWQPLGGVIWDVQVDAIRIALYSVFALGWATVLITTFLINHFDLFGLRQVYLHFRGAEYTPSGFKTPAMYKMVRHPLYLGFILAFWATPTMTITHLVFAGATTAYILVAIQLEERNLSDLHGEYAEYRKRVPMLIPRLFGKKSASA